MSILLNIAAVSVIAFLGLVVAAAASHSRGK